MVVRFSLRIVIMNFVLGTLFQATGSLAYIKLYKESPEGMRVSIFVDSISTEVQLGSEEKKISQGLHIFIEKLKLFVAYLFNVLLSFK